MTLGHGPRIVTDQLAFIVDAANLNSYPGIGTTVYDIGPNKLSGSSTQLVYDNTNGGSFGFNGFSTRMQTFSNYLGFDTTSKTMCAWINLTSAAASSTFISRMDTASAGWAFMVSSSFKLVFRTGSTEVADTGSGVVPTGAWCFVCIPYDFSATTAYYYYNAVLSGSKTTTDTSAANSSVNMQIGGLNTTLAGYLTGYIAHISLYNKALSAAEIQQNFNAHRGRFGV